MPFPKRPPTFALPVGDKGLQNLEDLQNYFLVDDILRHFQSGKLHTWCQDRRYMEQVDKLYAIADTSTRAEIVKQLIFIFNVKTVFISPKENVDADAYIKSNGQVLSKEAVIKEFLSDQNNIEKIVADYLANEENQAKIRKQFFADNANNKYNECKKLLLEVYDLLIKSYIGQNKYTHISIYSIKHTPYLVMIRGHLTIIIDNCRNEAIKILNDTSSLENIKLKFYFQELYNISSNSNYNIGENYTKELLEKLGFKKQ